MNCIYCSYEFLLECAPGFQINNLECVLIESFEEMTVTQSESQTSETTSEISQQLFSYDSEIEDSQAQNESNSNLLLIIFAPFGFVFILLILLFIKKCRRKQKVRMSIMTFL